MVNFQRKQRYGWEDLLTIMHLLRAPEGCPWDREQTHQSIRRNFLEETYEALDAIDRNDIPGMCEELGDVLLQVVFHSVMEEEQGRFTADDVVDGVAQKLVFRHTHVFGAAEAADDVVVFRRNQRAGFGGGLDDGVGVDGLDGVDVEHAGGYAFLSQRFGGLQRVGDADAGSSPAP